MSTASRASWPARNAAGARCAPPISPASSGSWRIGTRSTCRRSSPFRSMDARPIANSPTRLARMPPPTTTRSVPCHAGSSRSRPATSARDCANSSTTPCTSPAGLPIAFRQHLVELAAVDRVGRRFAERVLVRVLQLGAPMVEDRLEGAAARLVAEEAVAGAELGVVIVHRHAPWQGLAAVRRKVGPLCLVRHGRSLLALAGRERRRRGAVAPAAPPPPQVHAGRLRFGIADRQHLQLLDARRACAPAPDRRRRRRAGRAPPAPRRRSGPAPRPPRPGRRWSRSPPRRPPARRRRSRRRTPGRAAPAAPGPPPAPGPAAGGGSASGGRSRGAAACRTGSPRSRCGRRARRPRTPPPPRAAAPPATSAAPPRPARRGLRAT